MSNPAAQFRPDPSTIPTEPGCYLWRDRHGRVIYVGKAKQLRARLASYFGAWSGIHQRTRGMLEAARSVEWIVTANEVEALHLEYNLIKRHRPRYN
ncbi:MAG TPA: GIY-YIG nuclease family protein, partial [Euzebyales bacterium]|nr:GIY-YIG nuclease family protein [Euzebyales bacterium]